jgi:hypothetical protein
MNSASNQGLIPQSTFRHLVGDCLRWIFRLLVPPSPAPPVSHPHITASWRQRSISLAVGAALLLPALGLQAATLSFYVCTNIKELGIVSWDTANPAGTKSYQVIGSTGTIDLSDLALLPDGRLFGISRPVDASHTSELYQINRTNAALTLKGNTGLTLNALTYDTQNQRLLGGCYNNLVSINLTTGAATTVCSLSSLNVAGDLAFYNGTLYFTATTVATNFTSTRLATVNTTAGTAALVHPTNPIGQSSVWGLDAGSDGRLYGFFSSSVIDINTATGKQFPGSDSWNTLIYQFPGFSSAFWGATAIPPLTPPLPSAVVEPANNATGIANNPTLTWAASATATSYKLYVGTANPPVNLINGLDVGNITSYALTNLAAASDYYWKIVPYNTAGDAVGCPVWTFRTGAGIVPSMTAANAPIGTASEPWLVIDSDAENANAGYDRDSLPASAQVTFDLPVGVDSSTESYRVAAQLLDPAGVTVPLANANSGTTTLASAAQVVELTQLSKVREYTFSVRPDPAADLGAGKQYTLRYTVQRSVYAGTINGSATYDWVDTAVSNISTAFTVVHFTDATANTSNRYVRAYATAAPTWTRTYLLTTADDTTEQRFRVAVPYFAARYDLGGSGLSVNFRLTATVTDDTGANVPLQDGGISNYLHWMQPAVTGSPLTPLTESGSFVGLFRPASQLDSRNRTYLIKVSLEHLEIAEPATYQSDGESPQTVALQRLLHFNGNLRFGAEGTGLITVFSAFSNTPVAGALGTDLVNTTINVTAATIPAFPNYTFGDGSALGVQLLSNGDAVVTAGSQPVVVSGGGGIEATYGGVRVVYPSTVVLKPSGPEAGSALVYLPQGLSYTPDRAASAGRFLAQIEIPGTQALTNSFHFSGSFATPATAWVFDESRPLLYQVSNFTMTPEGELVFTAATSEWAHTAAADQLDDQQANDHEYPTMGLRLSNDGYLRYSQVVPGSNVSFACASDGSIRTQTADLTVDTGSFSTHFPLATEVAWSFPGDLKIRAGLVASDSELRGVNDLQVTYDGACADDACKPAEGTTTDSVILEPNSSKLRFTADGGIQTAGKLATDRQLKWGIRNDLSFTHRTDYFTYGDFLAPGNQLYASDNPQASAADLSPAVVMLAGYDKTNHSTPIYPTSDAYIAGAGTYAGVTFTVSQDGDIGASRIANMLDEYGYELKPNTSKYYVRASGVSGRHVAVKDTFNSLATLYDYPFAISCFQLTFLSNINHDSWFNGEVSVSAPANFTQKFLNMKLTCTGALSDAKIDPEDSGPKRLQYWNGSFNPLAIRFAPVVGASCYSDRTLTIGLTSGAANIPTPLAGTLAFTAKGNIGTLAENIEGVDSRLGMPSRVLLAGPGTENYSLVPVSKLYFNNPTAPGAPATGYVNFAATCSVPFFEDLQVHVMTSAQANMPAPLYMAGGWQEGWENQTFFTSCKFDSAHNGFPPGTSVTTYRSPTTDTEHVVRAKQSLFGLVDLDYPLQWNPSARYFQSWPEAPKDLLVLSVNHQIDYLSADNAEISFGAQYEGLPKINLVSAAIDVADNEFGASRALTNAATQVVTDTLNQGVSEIGNLVNDNMEKVLEQAITAIEDQVINPLYDEIRTSYDSAVASRANYLDWADAEAGALRTKLDSYLTDSAVTPSANGLLKQLASDTAAASSLIVRVSDALDRGILAIDSVTGQIQTYRDGAGHVVSGFAAPPGFEPDALVSGILREVDGANGGPPERQIAQALVRQLIAELAPPALAATLTPLDLNSPISGDLNKLLEEFDPSLDRITEALLEARAYLESVKAKLAPGQELLLSFQQIVNDAAGEIDGITAAMRTKAFAFIYRMADAANYGPGIILGDAGDLMAQFSKEEFTACLRAELRDKLLGSDFVAQIQYVLRQAIAEFDIGMRSAIDSVFTEMNRMCKALIKDFLGPLNDTINNLLGSVGGGIGAGSVDGYAHIQGDTLRRLRLDAKVQLKVPDEMKLQGYVEMLCYDSKTDTGTGTGDGLSVGDETVEVRMGAVDVPLDWVSPDLRANLDVWFAMQKEIISPNKEIAYPIGLGGSLVMTSGELDFQSLKITAFYAGMAVGLNDCYLAATATVVVSDYEASGGIFFGKTSTLEPLLTVDPEVASLLGTPPFTGAYVYGEVWLPLSEAVLGIPSSCMFRISAGVGAGAFYFAEGPTFGGRMLLGLSGEALCVVSIRGDVTMTGVMSGGSLRFAGNGTLKGKAGCCPFCVKFSDTARITYQDGSWEVDY